MPQPLLKTFPQSFIQPVGYLPLAPTFQPLTNPIPHPLLNDANLTYDTKPVSWEFLYCDFE